MSKKQTVVDRDTGEVLEVQDSKVNIHHEGRQERPRLRAVFLDDLGRELVDPTPVAPPLGYKKQPSIFELQRQQIALHHRLYAEDREFETFEESEDFDVADDVDPTSPWENDFDPPMSEVRLAIEAHKRAQAQAGQPPKSPPPPPPPSQQGDAPEPAQKPAGGLPAQDKS